MNSEKERLVKRLRIERDLFEVVISPMSEDQMRTLQITSCWTVKDILAHITAWEVELLRWLDRASTGKAPEIPAPGEWAEYTDEFNDQSYLANQDRPLDDVLLEFQEVYRRVLFELEALPNNLDDDYWSVWFGGKPPWDLLAAHHEHYREHRGEICSRLANEQ